jgi:hypothetical protein
VHALRVVQAASGDEAAASAGAAKRARRRGSGQPARCPKLDVREEALARAIWWLLRLRRAQTCFYRVPAHKGFTQNAFADALASRGAEHGPLCELPLRSSIWSMLVLALSFLIGQSELDGGVGGLGVLDGVNDGVNDEAKARRRRAAVARPEPTGPSTALTHVLALDCEVVGVGLRAFGGESRLASVSIVNEDGNQVYFSYAKPAKPVTDYRTKYSGIVPEMLVDAPPAQQVPPPRKRPRTRAL